MDEDFTEVTTQNYCSKMKDAIVGVGIGFLLFFGSIGGLAWNEGRTVRTARDLAEGRENVVEVPLAQALNDAGSMVLIHTSGETTTSDVISDPLFGVSAESLVSSTASSNSTTADTELLKLYRSVEMYQWVEKVDSRSEKTSTGGTRTIKEYSYTKQWSSALYDSSEFGRSDRPQGEPLVWQGEVVENPQAFPFPQSSWVADPILLGNLTLSTTAVNGINNLEPINYVSLDDVPDASLQSELEIFGSGQGLVYRNGTDAQPQVGDTRMQWSAVRASTISVIGEVSVSNELVPWTTSRMGELLLVEQGIRTSSEMFQKAEDANTTLGWILRGVGFIVMVVSITLVLQPLSTALDIIPFVGDCIGEGMSSCLFPLIGCIISLPITLLVIMIAWTWHRPVFAVPVAAGCAALLCCLCYRIYTKQPSASTSNNSKPPNHQAYEQQQPAYGQQQTYKPYGQQEADIPVATAQPMYQANAGQVPSGSFANALDP